MMAIGVVLFGIAPDAMSVQTPPRQSARIVAFSDDTDQPTDDPVKTLAAESAEHVDPPRRIVLGHVVPPAPRVHYTEKKSLDSLVSQPARFEARPATASSLSINSPFGVRIDPFTGNSRMHTGMDLRAEYGDTVGSAMSGTVTFAGERRGYGNLVVVDHGNGVSTYYAHLSAVAVGIGDTVDAGQLIGLVGSTGRSTGPHLHYEVRAYGHPFDPSLALEFDGYRLYLHGQPVIFDPDGAAPFALPAAPGSTAIAVNWDESSAANSNLLAVDFE